MSMHLDVSFRVNDNKRNEHGLYISTIARNIVLE